MADERQGLVDELIRETLTEQAEVLPLPPGVWARLQDAPRPPLWRRLRIGAKLEVAAVLLLIMGLVGLGVLRNAPRVESVVGPGVPITIEEYAVVARSVDRPGHLEYSERLTEAMLAKRASWRDRQRGGHRVVYLNETLAPTGYKLVEAAGGTYDLYKGDQLIASGLGEVNKVAVSDDGKEFAFVANVWESGAVLVTSAGTWPWDLQKHMFLPPAFAGNDLVEITVDGTLSRFSILRNGQEVYQGALPPVMAEYPAKGFYGWNGHWVVELKGDILIDGKSLKAQHGYDEVFGWRLIDDKPFYFYRVGDQVGISYDGRHQGALYDEVMHYGCCEMSAFNPMGNETMVWFHARKGETWYYVEAGVYR